MPASYSLRKKQSPATCLVLEQFHAYSYNVAARPKLPNSLKGF